MGHMNAVLRFVVTADITHEALAHFATSLSPWLDVAVVPPGSGVPATGRYFVAEGPPGTAPGVAFSAATSGLVPSSVSLYFRGGGFSSRELRVAELTFSSCAGARPVVIRNRVFTGLGTVAFVSGVDTLRDIGDALGFDLGAALCATCVEQDGAWLLRCWSCCQDLPPHAFAPVPFLECVRRASVDGVWPACGACTARRSGGRGTTPAVHLADGHDAVCVPMWMEAPAGPGSGP